MNIGSLATLISTVVNIIPIQEVDQMRKELGNFGPEFFDETEDLKYNYRQSVQRNVLLEEKLKNVEKQFSVRINIP